MKRISILLFSFLFLTSIGVLITNSRYVYWFGGNYDSFDLWYPSYGVYIWALKNIISILLFGLYLFTCYCLIKRLKNQMISFFKRITRSIPINILPFVLIITTTFIVKDFYPFSFYPMYNTFPNYAYTFFFEDENGNSLDGVILDDHGNISHIYFAEFHNRNWICGNQLESREHLDFIGKIIIRKSFNIEKLKEKNIHQINMFRLNNHFINDTLKIDTLKIATYDF